MELMDRILQDDCWNDFLAHKTAQNNMPAGELAALKRFVEEKQYVRTADRILEEYRLSSPFLHEVNKPGTGTKRIVYRFPEDENFFLKLLSFLAIREYDSLFADSLLSFRSVIDVKTGVESIRKRVNFSHTCSLKIDLHDYFNAADPVLMLADLKEAMPKEKKFLCLCENLLNDPYAIRDGKKVECRKGLMAGMPLSGFFSNLYLTCLDRWFTERSIPSIRYSDDIIVFADTPEELREYEAVIRSFLSRKGLEPNERKVLRTMPGEMVDFLGFEFRDSSVNLSMGFVRIMKNAIRRKAHQLLRRKQEKGLPDAWAIKAFIRFLNRRFYDTRVQGGIAWSCWFFPVLTETDRLAQLDRYAVQCMRYIASGNHSRKSYSLRYQTIQSLGYHSLVNSFWRYRKGHFDMEERTGERLLKQN